MSDMNRYMMWKLEMIRRFSECISELMVIKDNWSDPDGKWMLSFLLGGAYAVFDDINQPPVEELEIDNIIEVWQRCIKSASSYTDELNLSMRCARAYFEGFMTQGLVLAKKEVEK